MLNDKHYGQENILIHEFAHSVMCIGMDDEQRHSICAAFQEAQQSGSYQRHIYMMENADEYWAEATQSWFDATIRTGGSLYANCWPNAIGRHVGRTAHGSEAHLVLDSLAQGSIRIHVAPRIVPILFLSVMEHTTCIDSMKLSCTLCACSCRCQ